MSLSELMMLVNNNIEMPLNEIIGDPQGKTASSATLFDYMRLQNQYLKRIAGAVDSTFVIQHDEHTLGEAGIIMDVSRAMTLLGLSCEVTVPEGQSGSVQLMMVTNLGNVEEIITEAGKYWLWPDMTFRLQPVDIWLPFQKFRVLGGLEKNGAGVAAKAEISYI